MRRWHRAECYFKSRALKLKDGLTEHSQKWARSKWTWALLRDPCLTNLRLEGMLKDASSLGVRQEATDVGLCVS